MARLSCAAARAFGAALLTALVGCASPFASDAARPDDERGGAAAPIGLEARPSRRFAYAEQWADRRLGAIRGITVGPIENARHPGRGYGSEACGRAMDEAVAMGATWVSLTPFGRVWDLSPSGIDRSFEAPFEQNRRDVLAAIEQAHARGLRVLLVPHLWVESGGWRAEIDPGSDAEWARWAADYKAFLLTWAEVAREGGAEMLSVGVELRSWVTTPRASSFLAIIDEVRGVYPGLLTYSANWDDAADTLIFDALDLIGINAFYPLTDREEASREQLAEGGRRVAEGVAALARGLRMPVVLTEVGYTTRRDPALRPWEWPDAMTNVRIDERAQADAYAAVFAGFIDYPWFAGLFVWRVYADPEDVSQEAEWGFSPRGKRAELVMRDAFGAHWAADGALRPGEIVGLEPARTPGIYPITGAPQRASAAFGR